jgi:Fe-S cluster biogenesis protein NfuA
MDDHRLRDEDVHERLARLDEVLGQLEQTPGQTAEAALDAVSLLTEVYGEALARIMDVIAGGAADATLAKTLAADELIGHLLVLHDIHPAPVEDRVKGALASIRPYLQSHGGDVQLAGISGGVARVVLAGSCDGCSSSAQTLEFAVEQAVLAAAPELSRVAPVRAASQDTGPLIPPEALLRKPPAAAGRTAGGAA